MFQIVDLPKTPKIARRLLDMANIGAVKITDDITNLAKEGVVSQSDLPGFPVSLSEKELQTIQFIRDRNGRGVVLEGVAHNIFTRATVLGYVMIEDAFPLLIIANNHLQQAWIQSIRTIWPNKRINVCRGTHAATDDEHVNDVVISSEPLEDCDIYFVKPALLNQIDITKKVKINQVVVNYVPDIGSVTRITVDNTKNICLEIQSSLVIINLQQCVSIARTKNTVIGIDDINWQDINLATRTSFEILSPHSSLPHYLVGEHGWINSHLEENGITPNRRAWLPILNICPYLVE